MMRFPVFMKLLCAALAWTALVNTAVAQGTDGEAVAPPEVATDSLPNTLPDGEGVDPAELGAALNLEPAEDQLIRQILVEGVLRVEPNTVLSYLSVQPGDIYDPAEINRSMQTLFATGLFSDVGMTLREDNVLVVTVEESPIINRVMFEGNNALDTEDLQDEIEAGPRQVFTEARVQADAQRIIELYRRSGRFAATVTPTIVELPQNRVDVVFEIAEGQITGVRRINFIGNESYSDGRLRRVIATEESRFWRFFSSNTNYDPDRLEYDRELLREFYADRGYAEFRVTSAVAELTPDQRGFYITFTVEEGQRYRYGDISVETELDSLNSAFLNAIVPLETGDEFVLSDIEDTIDLLTFASGTAGYAFVDITRQLEVNQADNTVDITFQVSEGPRVYIERIDILGNTATLDRVIRREMEVVEGDAFNRVLLDRSQSNMRALGFFENVEIEETPGTREDSTIVQVSVTEQPTGELSFGAGYSSVDAFLIDLSVTQRNLRGRGQYFRFAVSASSRRTTIDMRFQEPRFLDRNLSAAIDLFRIETDFAVEAGFDTKQTGVGVRFGFPISENTALGLRYTLRNDEVRAFTGANLQVLNSSGGFLTSLVGYTFNWSTLNDPIDPTRGFDVSLMQDFAGVGGDVKYLRTEVEGGVYRGILPGVVASFLFDAGYINGWGGDPIRLNDRYFKGGYTFRGFETAGIGPRVLQEITNPDGSTTLQAGNALGGKAYAIGALELTFPLGLPDQYGVRGGVFTEFGTVGLLDSGATSVPAGSNIFIDDGLDLRASAGVTVFWDSPFGPVRFDFSRVLLKEEYDQTESFRFSQSTRF